LTYNHLELDIQNKLFKNELKKGRNPIFYSEEENEGSYSDHYSYFYSDDHSNHFDSLLP
jgi:hypothetical protein